jgi:hypothetical protein
MAYGQEKVVVKLRDDEKLNALIETCKDGKERTYYPRRFATHWNCEKLQVRQDFGYRNENDLDPPTMLTYVTGVARLVSGSCVSVIGELENVTTTVELSFRPDDSLNLLKVREDEKDEGLMFSQPYGCADMGFRRADWEFQSSDRWWLECRLHSTALQHLVHAISSGSLKEISLSARFNNLFTDGHPYMPLSRSERLFLRPSKQDNTIEMPEMAQGWLERLGLGLLTFDLAPPPPIEPELDYEDKEQQVDVSDPSPQQPEIQTLPLIAARIEALRGTIKWVGGLIAVALFLLLLK